MTILTIKIFYLILCKSTHRVNNKKNKNKKCVKTYLQGWSSNIMYMLCIWIKRL